MAERAPGAPEAHTDAGLDSRVETSPVRLKGRYEVEEVLGRGGMAAVHRAVDRASGQQVALKRLVVPTTDKHCVESAALFEREFHTLAQLSHPHVIAVYDFDVDESGPFYTMELLDAGDVRGMAPIPWETACSLFYDVCSALALVHSRRLVHRDVTPRNIRTTRDGRAKLIDFGAMVPMGPGGLIVGTPQFVAPEVVNRSSLDARTDLFSLGASFYYALTGRSPFPAKDFAQLFDVWEVKPLAPSRIAPDVPEALDALVLSLLAIDPASRPKSAFEVMQRLGSVARIHREESLGVSRAYLSTPVLVGRDALQSTLDYEMKRAFGGRGRGVVIQAAAGLGRSRMLDACSLAAKTFGATVLRASGRAAVARNFHVAGLLAEQLVQVAPDIALRAARAEGVANVLFEPEPADGSDSAPSVQVRDFSAPTVGRVALQAALGAWFRRVSKERPLAIAVDDVHRIDEASAALLAALASQADRERLLVAATAESGIEPVDRLAFDVLTKNSTRLSLGPLGREETERLLTSVFGDVPNVRILSDGIFKVAAGNPRATMDVAQHLVDKGVVRYEDGAWTLPPRLEAADLPASAEEAIRARLAALSPLARFFVEAQSVATHLAFTREDYARLRPSATATDVDAAILDLVSGQVVASDGRVYTLLHAGFQRALVSALSPEELRDRHRHLSMFYEGRLKIGVVRHALLAGLETRALDTLAPLIAETPEATSLYDVTDIATHELAATFERALDAAERLGRPARETNELRRWLASLSVASDDKYYWRAVPEWLERLKLDSGYTAWQAHADIVEAGPRLSRAMQVTYERYMATPEAERVYRPDEAIKGLVRYVAISIAIGSSRIDGKILESLPRILEPFAPLSELVYAVWQNSLATLDSTCRARPESARARWIDVYDRLGRITGNDAQYADIVRHAVAFGLGSMEAWLGMEAAAKRAEALDDDPLQQVNAFYLRRIVRMQQGDWDGAERFRKQAEILSLQARSRQMFTTLTSVELSACAMARDITGVKQCADKIRGLAASAPGWIPNLRLAEGRLALVCDSYEDAVSRFDEALTIVTPKPESPYPLHTAWCASVAGKAEGLIGLERFDEARAVAEQALDTAERLGIGAPSHEIGRMLALAHAKLGDFDGARQRLERIIARQLELGITGLHLGASYEACARVAIWEGDEAAVEEYSRLTAREYRHGQGSPLGARYERLMADARRTAKGVLPGLSDFQSSRLSSAVFPQTSATVVVTQAMKGADGSRERAERALGILCHARSATAGHLYLFGDRGIRHAASHGPEPPRGLSSFVEEYVQRELSEADVATEFVDGEATESSDTQNQFADGRGSIFYPILLTAMVDGGMRYAGVAALALPDTPKAMDVELVVALGTHLVQAGDTRGLRP